MANVINRTTLEYRRSVNDPDYPPAVWLVVPPGSGNATLIDTVPPRYLVLTGDVLSEMDQSAKDAVDAALLAAAIAAEVVRLQAESDGESPLGIDIRSLIQVNNKRINWLTNRVIEIQDTMEAIRDQTFGTQARQNVAAGFPMNTATRPLPAAIADYQADVADAEVSG